MSDTCDAGSPPVDAPRALAGVAVAQHGVVTRAQVLEAGFRSRTIDRRVRGGTWERLARGVYRIAGTPATWRQALVAAALAWGAPAAISHRAAAALWELPGFPGGPVELLVPRDRRRAAPGLVHRPLTFPLADLTAIDGIPVTSAARTLVDLAAVAPRHRVEDALDDAIRRGLATVAELWIRLEVATTQSGARALRRLVRERRDLATVPQSALETRLFRLLGAARLPKPVLQHRIQTPRGPAVVDFAFPEQRVAIEADGFRWHSSRRAWDHDRARRNALVAQGWTVVHVTWADLRARPGDVVATIRAALRSSRHN